MDSLAEHSNSGNPSRELPVDLDKSLAVTRTRIVDEYQKFKSVVDPLRTSLTANPEMAESESLGGGRYEYAIPLTFANREYVMRFPKDPTVKQDMIERFEGAIRGLGIRGLEQVVAVSLEDQVFISEHMPGKIIRRVEIEDQQRITDDQLSDLIETVVLANARGISIDTDQANILYDSKKGFGIVDYWYKEGLQHRIADTIVATAISIGTMGRGAWNRNTPDEVRKRQYATSAALMKRFSVQCNNHVGGEHLDEIHRRIAQQVSFYEKDL